MVRSAVLTAVRASISTPVEAVVFAVRGDRDAVVPERKIHAHHGERNLMAERDEMTRLLRRHDARDARDREDVALLNLVLADQFKRGRLKLDVPGGDGFATRRRLGGNVHHAGLALFVGV